MSLVPYGANPGAGYAVEPGSSLVPGLNPALAARLGLMAQTGPVNPEQVKIQLRIAEIQSLYSRPRS